MVDGASGVSLHIHLASLHRRNFHGMIGFFTAFEEEKEKREYRAKENTSPVRAFMA